MWIEDYRKEHGLELDDFARRVNLAGCKLEPPLEGVVTDMLIHILEISKTPRTHPRIANAIAMACGATPEQRDSIVDERHRGKWHPKPDDYNLDNVRVRRVQSEYKFGLPRAVVEIDRRGMIIARYESIKTAAEANCISKDFVSVRCRREPSNEFSRTGSTYRYADEWDNMTRTEKLKDLGVDVGE